MTKLDAEVVVVGGGPGGSCTAWHLAQMGVDVMLVDRARFPRDKVCSEYLSPEASRILSDMGVLTAIENAGAAQLAGMVVWSPSGTMVRGDFSGQHGFRGFRDRGLALRRTILDEILIRRAEHAGARVREGLRVVDVMRSPSGRVSGVVATDANGVRTEIRSTIVIGADGLRSVVGRRLNLVRTSRWPRRVALVAHYRGVPGISDTGEIYLDRDGYSGFADVGNGLTNAAVVVPAGRASGIVDGRTEFFESWFSNRPHLAPRLAGAERVSAVRATGPFASAARVAWAPGAALVGDSADFFDPITGEGIYAALRGGELLAPFAAAAVRGSVARSDGELREYDRARRREFSGKWKIERLVSMAVSFPMLANRMARVLARRKDMADLFAGVAGDFVPPKEILNARFLLTLAFARGLRP